MSSQQRNSAMDNTPQISVLMAVYNEEDYVKDAIESILNQSFKNFEFIIVDDGSTDHTPQILTTYARNDNRVRVITQKNTGLTRALNNGLKECKAPLVARQDADDVSYPDRLQKQYNFMIARQNADVVLLGGVCDDSHIDGTKTLWPYYNNVQIKGIIHLKSPFAHSTAMFRRDEVEKLKGYDTSYKTSQDMELWMRMHEVGRIEMIEKPILLRRINNQSISAKRKFRQFYDSSHARLKHSPWFKPKLRALGYSLKIGILSTLPLSLKNKLICAIKQKNYKT